MDTLEYKPMRCATFEKVRKQIRLSCDDPTEPRPKPAEERRMKIHAILCIECKKTLEREAATNDTLAVILQEILNEESLNEDVLENLIKPGEADDLWSKQLLFEPMLFRDDEEPPPNSLPMVTGPVRAPATAQTRLTRDRAEDPRHAHFEKTLDVDGDD